MAKKLSKEEWEQRINDAGAGRYEFVRWLFDDKFGSNHKCVAVCVKDGCVWESKVNNLVDSRQGCPHCAGVRRWKAEERIEQINELENIEFISWVDSYKGANSKANVKCTMDGYGWCASVSHLVNGGRGCPKCSKHGFQIDNTGYLYALRSECGQYIKVGISNVPKRRHKALERATPFTFNLVEQFSGDGVKIYELEKHFHSKYESAGFAGFDGATEWLVCSDELLSELRVLSIEHE